MIVAGIGCRAEVREESLISAFAAAGGGSVDAVATVAVRAELEAVRAFAARLGVGLVAVAPVDLAAQATLTRSPASLRAHGTGSVAEAAALAAAGPGAQLLGARHVSADRLATCALAMRGDER